MPELSLDQVGQQTLTVSTVAVALTLPSGKTPRHALIFVATNPIRWRADGTAPTGTAGMYVASGNYINWTDPQTDALGLIRGVQMIRDTSAAGDATVEICYMA